MIHWVGLKLAHRLWRWATITPTLFLLAHRLRRWATIEPTMDQRWNNVGLLLTQCLRRWTNIKLLLPTSLSTTSGAGGLAWEDGSNLLYVFSVHGRQMTSHFLPAFLLSVLQSLSDSVQRKAMVHTPYTHCRVCTRASITWITTVKYSICQKCRGGDNIPCWTRFYNMPIKHETLIQWLEVVLMQVQRRRRWACIKTTLNRRLVPRTCSYTTTDYCLIEHNWIW